MLLVLSQIDDETRAQNIARTLVQEQWAACVTVLPQATAFYQWQGQLEQAQELCLMIKTRAELYPGLEQRLRELHSYELPEIIAIPCSSVLPEYLAWVTHNTRGCA